MISPKYSYTTRSAEELLSDPDIYIPKFQRGLCWTQKQRQEYLAACASGDLPGYPILCIDEEDDERKSYLIDFQQRYHALADYQHNPGKYYPFYVEKTSEIYAIIASDLMKANVQENFDVIKIINSIVEDHFANGKEAQDKRYIRSAIERKFGVELSRESSDKLVDAVEQIHEDIKKYIELDKIMLSITQLVGTGEDAARNYCNLNAKGKPLTKYEIWHAVWDRDCFALSNTENNDKILEIVISHYHGQKKTRDDRLQSEFSAKEVRTSREVNFYELALGLGSQFISLAPAVCSDSKKKNIELGCSILGIITQEDVNSEKFASAVAKHLSAFEDQTFTESMVDAVFATANTMQSVFSTWLAIPVLGSQKYNSAGVSNAFIAAAFASLFYARYDVDWAAKTVTVKKDAADQATYRNMLKNLPAWLLYETVEDSFLAGSGTNYLKSFYLPNTDGEIVNQKKYSSAIDKDTLHSALSYWHGRSYDDIMAKSPSSETVMLLMFFTNSNKGLYNKEGYDIEHIFDQKLCKNAVWAPHVLGNLMYMSSPTNRSKQNIFLWDFIDKHDGTSIDADYIEQIFYPDTQACFEVKNARQGSKNKAFIKHTRARGEKMIEEIVAAVC